MKVLWREWPLTAQEVCERFSRKEEWNPKTTRSLLNRLANKEAVKTERRGRAYWYSPAVRESECVGARSEEFLDRVFDGSLQPMLKHFVEQKKLSSREIRELKRILEGRD